MLTGFLFFLSTKLAGEACRTFALVFYMRNFFHTSTAVYAGTFPLGTVARRICNTITIAIIAKAYT